MNEREPVQMFPPWQVWVLGTDRRKEVELWRGDSFAEAEATYERFRVKMPAYEIALLNGVRIVRSSSMPR